jgi:dihydrofolate synthase / folylpolyglutamate synthase
MDEHRDVLNKLYGLQKVGVKLGLERTFKLFERIGNPQEKLKFIHVAGTNGKGSVCATVAKALENAGYKVGFYSSPHLVSLRERFRINGNAIGWDVLEALVDEIWPVVKDMRANKEYITFFEVTVALAAKYFEKNKCDFVLWETGMGGRLDSTNIVSPIVTAITGIGLDHEAFLGNTEAKIATEKAGIIKKDIPVFVGNMASEAFDVIHTAAKEKGSKFISAMDDIDLNITRKLKKETLLAGWEFSIKNKPENKYFFPLPGEVQPNNLKLSCSILSYLSEKYLFSFFTALAGIENLRWPGRIHLLSDGKILDGAHNPQGIREFVSTIKECYPNQSFKIIFGCLAEREPANALKLLSEIADEFVFVPIKSVRPCFSAEKIASISKTETPNIAVSIKENTEAALKYVGKSKTAIVGSLYLAGEILKKYYDIDDIVNI